ncbi:MAG: acyl-CoA carboxylase subunit beta [Spirochaetales bacterium]
MPEFTSDEAIAKQHTRGKLTASERLESLLDPGSFVEQNRHIRGRVDAFGLGERLAAGDGVVTGTGLVNGRQVWLAAQDFTLLGGSLGEMHAKRIADAAQAAIATGSPFIQINDSGGARIQEGVLSLHGYGTIFRANTEASGVVPQISVILGPCAGGAVYSPAITDFILMVDGVSNMYITGPAVIKQVTGEEISQEELGGTAAHATKSGVAHKRFSTEAACFAWIKELLSLLPSSNRDEPPLIDADDASDRDTPELASLIPDNEHAAYDIRAIITSVGDHGSFLEIHDEYAQNIVVGFSRFAGRTVGIIANQPQMLAGALDINASDKAARFVRFCDAFSVPVLSLVDVPGFLPGVQQEHGGIIRHGAKLLYAIAEARVPKVAVVLRKAFGGAFISMASKGLGYDRVLALPRAQIAVMGPEGAASIIFRREIEGAEDREAARAAKVAEFKEQIVDPHVAAGFGFVDDVISVEHLRSEIVRSFESLARKQESRPPKRHGNIPL